MAEIYELQEVEVWDGNMAASHAMRQAQIDVVSAYPITPSTPIVQNYASFLEYLHKQTANSVYAKYYNYTFTLTRFTPGVEWWLHLAPRTSHLAPSTARCLCAKNDTLRSATVTTTRGGRWLHLPPASPLTFKHSTPPVSSDALTFCVASSPRGQPLT